MVMIHFYVADQKIQEHFGTFRSTTDFAQLCKFLLISGALGSTGAAYVRLIYMYSYSFCRSVACVQCLQSIFRCRPSNLMALRSGKLFGYHFQVTSGNGIHEAINYQRFLFPRSSWTVCGCVAGRLAPTLMFLPLLCFCWASTASIWL